MPFEAFLVILIGLGMVSSFLLFRGVRKGSALFALRSVYAGGLLIALWFAFRAYFYFTHGVLSASLAVVPAIGLFMIIYHGFRWAKISKDEQRG